MMETALFWVGVFAALAYLPMTRGGTSLGRSIVKTVPLLAFAGAAWAGAAPAWLVAALFFSALGDFALSRRGDAAFLYGLSAFALAHVAYVLLFLQGSGHGLWEAFTLAPVLAVLLVGNALASEVWLAPHTGGLRWPVRSYIAIITAMGLAALTFPPGLLLLGAALFIASDTLLAIELFRLRADHPAGRAVRLGIWVLYIAGQALILRAITG